MPDLKLRFDEIKESLKENEKQVQRVLDNASRTSAIRDEIFRWNEEYKVTNNLMCPVPPCHYRVAELMTIKTIY